MYVLLEVAGRLAARGRSGLMLPLPSLLLWRARSVVVGHLSCQGTAVCKSTSLPGVDNRNQKLKPESEFDCWLKKLAKDLQLGCEKIFR